METNGIILNAENLCKEYRLGTSKVQVLKGISLQVRRGQIVAIVGPSGVGKSTLLHILGTLDHPTSGTVEIDHTKIFEFDDKKLAHFRNKTVGFVFQFHHLLPEFTALENVMMPSLISGKIKSKIQQRAADLLYEVGLGHRLNHRPNELSGGELQRVAVARSLMNEPKLVLADEPSGNLDLESSNALHDLLWKLSRKYKMTFIIVTHNLELAESADKVIELFDGRIKREQLNQIS
ncbi:ABC transporter ATP-binding protein [bacterium]|nr:ABC transporter ATP-binding protein [bacterium]